MCDTICECCFERSSYIYIIDVSNYRVIYMLLKSQILWCTFKLSIIVGMEKISDAEKKGLLIVMCLIILHKVLILL
jgi:hypothetical protein